MKPDISRFKHLWDGSEPGWILLGEGRPSPFNVLTSMTVLIEANDEFAAVVEQMRGLVPIARNLPELEELRTRALETKASSP